MTRIPKQAISEFQQIYRKEYGVKISFEEAQTEARRLLIFFYNFMLFIQEEAKKKQNLTD